MAEPQAANGKPFDPLDPWRQMRDNYLDAWAKTMIDVVNTDAYAHWLYRVKPAAGGDAGKLLDAAGYAKVIGNG